MPFCPGVPISFKALRAKDYPISPTTLGGHLKKRRRELGVRQEDVAKLIRVGRDTYYDWENGRTKPRRAHYTAICSFLGYDPRLFLPPNG